MEAVCSSETSGSVRSLNVTIYQTLWNPNSQEHADHELMNIVLRSRGLVDQCRHIEPQMMTSWELNVFRSR
jgi:hypothetical protein